MAVESLATLCVLSLIDHRDLLGDLGDMDLSLLRPVFEHCTADQLDRIENENKVNLKRAVCVLQPSLICDRDFTPFTDDLWERCYERRYGIDGVEQVQDRMKQAKVLYTWRQLYHARQQADDRTQQKCVSRLKELYHRAEEGPSSQAAAWANKAGSSMLKKARLGYANRLSSLSHPTCPRLPPSPPPPPPLLPSDPPPPLPPSPPPPSPSPPPASLLLPLSFPHPPSHSPLPRAMGMEARGQVREQARGSSGAGILNIVDHRQGFVGAEEAWEGGKRRCRDGEGSRERRMNSGIDRDRDRDWEWESGGGESGEEERDMEDHEEEENHGKRRRETGRGRGRGNGRDAEQDGEWNRNRSKGYGRGVGGGNDRRQADGVGGKSQHGQTGSKERVAERGAGSFKGKRKVESSMDWGV
ncbi:unnamed protein product [Closterium sp. NIES-65]|nr:unnamed protein product [Closterium sp. NIES-65]